MPYVLFLIISLLWSTSFILMKKAALGFTPAEIGMWRCLWGAGLLGVLCWRSGELVMPPVRRWPLILGVTVLGCAWPYAIQPYVIARQGSAFMALAVSFVPLGTVIASVLLLRVWPTARQMVGVCGALVCLALLLLDGLDRKILIVDFVMALSVPFGYAMANTLLRGWLRDIPATTITLYLLTLTALILWPITLYQVGVEPRSDADWISSGSLAFLGLFGTGLGTYWFNQLIRDHGPLFAGMTTNVVPIGAVLWGWADGEYISARQVIALLGIVCMVMLVQFGAANQRAEK